MWPVASPPDDLGDLDAVYGLDEESDTELSPRADLMTKAPIWLWQHRRGYLPIQDRDEDLRRYLESLGHSDLERHAS